MLRNLSDSPQSDINFHENRSSRIKGRDCLAGVLDISVHTHTRARARLPCLHPDASKRVTFIDVLDYSEYSDSNISIFRFHENIAFSGKEKKKIRVVLNGPKLQEKL